MTARRLASLAGTVAVTVIAAVASYAHMRDLALSAGQSPLLAALLPMSVDGMMLVATVALGDGRRSKWSAWAAFLVGVAASLAANVMAAGPDPVARVVSAWPAVALLLTVEVLARSGRSTPTVEAVAATVQAVTVTPPDTAPALAMATTPPVAEAVKDTAARRRPAVAGTAGVAGGTAARVAALVADRPDVTAAEVAETVTCSPRTARRHLAAIRTATT